MPKQPLCHPRNPNATDDPDGYDDGHVADESAGGDPLEEEIAIPADVSVNARLEVDDEQAVMAWARRHCLDTIQVAERLSRSVLKEHVEQTGEVPDVGVHIEPEKETFSIK